MGKKIYPFIPEKISEIEEGEFFAIPLQNGHFACGRLLLIRRQNGRKTQRVLVGLHDWSGKNFPTADDIHQCPILEQGEMHILSIAHIGGEVLGYKSFTEDQLAPLVQFQAGYLLDGFTNLGGIPTEEWPKYSRRTTYGLDVIRLLAEKHFGNGPSSLISGQS